MYKACWVSKLAFRSSLQAVLNTANQLYIDPNLIDTKKEFESRTGQLQHDSVKMHELEVENHLEDVKQHESDCQCVKRTQRNHFPLLLLDQNRPNVVSQPDKNN